MLKDDIREAYEDETLGVFSRFRQDEGHPGYFLVERRESPDRVVTLLGESEHIGVEITRVVTPSDAEAGTREVYLAQTIREVLSDHARGGRVHLYSGNEIPDTSPQGLAAIRHALQSDIARAGGLTQFVAGLEYERWEFGDACFTFEPNDGDRWRVTNNHVPHRRRNDVPETEIDGLLLREVEKKATKAPRYAWNKPLVLLVRNGYQPYVPATDTISRTTTLCAGVFAEAWLVNYRHGVIDACPPEPRLVRLG